MTQFNQLIEKVTELTSGSIYSTNKKDAIDAVNTLIIEFMHEQSKTKDVDILCELIRKVPSALFFCRYRTDEVKDNELLRKLILAFFNFDQEFMNSFDRNSIFVNDYATLVSYKWVEDHALIFNEELYDQIISQGTNIRTFRVFSIFIEGFLKTVKDKSDLTAKLHKDSLTEDGFIQMPQTLIRPLAQYVDIRTFEAIKSSILSNKIFYHCENQSLKKDEHYVEQEKLFDQYLSDSDIEALLECNTSSYQEVNMLERFIDRLKHPQIEKLIKSIVEASYPTKTTIGHHTSTYKKLSQKVIDATADIAIQFSPYCYIYFNEADRLKYINAVDFNSVGGLLKVHPLPETIGKDRWLDAISQNEISLKDIPSHLIVGDKKVTDDEWLEMIHLTNGGNNKIFSALAKHQKDLVTEALLEQLSSLSIKASEHPRIYAYKEQQAKKKLTEKMLADAVAVAKLGDAREIAKSLTKLVASNLGNKDVFEKVIQAVIDSK